MKCNILSSFLVSLLMIATLMSGACATQYLDPDKKIEDTPENRDIMSIVEQYQEMMEKRDFNGMKALTSADYYENASTTDSNDDDWGGDELHRVLDAANDTIKQVIFRINLKSIYIEEPFGYADYQYVLRFRYEDGDKPRWIEKIDQNQLKLIKEGTDWKIMEGL